VVDVFVILCVEGWGWFGGRIEILVKGFTGQAVVISWAVPTKAVLFPGLDGVMGDEFVVCSLLFSFSQGFKHNGDEFGIVVLFG
jgi:hypothetical protein